MLWRRQPPFVTATAHRDDNAPWESGPEAADDAPQPLTAGTRSGAPTGASIRAGTLPNPSPKASAEQQAPSRSPTPTRVDVSSPSEIEETPHSPLPPAQQPPPPPQEAAAVAAQEEDGFQLQLRERKRLKRKRWRDNVAARKAAGAAADTETATDVLCSHMANSRDCT